MGRELRNYRLRFKTCVSSDEHCGRSCGNRIGCPGFDHNVPLARSGETTDHHGCASHSDHSSDVRLRPIEQRANMGIGTGAPCRLTGDQHGWATRSGAQRSSVTRYVSQACGRLSHSFLMRQLILTSDPRIVKVAPAFNSSVPAASMEIDEALMRSAPLASSIIAPELLSTFTVLPFSS